MTKAIMNHQQSFRPNESGEKPNFEARKAYNEKLRDKHCGKLAAQTFEMRYCKCCLKKYLQGVDLQEVEEYVGLKVPVIDDWGIVYLASIAIKLADFLELLQGPQQSVDLSGYAILLKLEDMRRQDAAIQ